MENVMQNEAFRDQESTFRWVWERVREIAPSAMLMRAPAVGLEPIETVGGGDLDILLPDRNPMVKDFLLRQGFRQEYAPPSYLSRFRLRLPQFPGPIGVDLYKVRAWGSGYCAVSAVEMTPSAGVLLRAAVDGKGPRYFQERCNGVPPTIRRGQRILRGSRLFSVAGLLISGVIKPDLRLMARTMFRRMGCLLLRLRQKPGLEISLLGVDGTGKSTVAAALASLSPRVRSIYLGDNFRAWPTRLVEKYSLPRPLPQIARHYELFTRRVKGYALSWRGYVVIYDRHPMERLVFAPRTLREKLNNWCARLYAWPVDHTYWFTGDPEQLWKRKREHPPEKLHAMSLGMGEMLRAQGTKFETVDVTANDLPRVIEVVSQGLMALYRQHLDIACIPGWTGRMIRAGT